MKSRLKPSLFTAITLFLSICLMVQTIYARPHALNETQRLAGLCKVWGLVKYYHPEVAKGQIDWDQVLIDTIPQVKAAQDYNTYNQVLDNLITYAGDVTNQECNPQTQAHPNEKFFHWTKNNHTFNAQVRHKLHLLYKKHVPAENYYVQLQYEGGPATFFNEKYYFETAYPEENIRLLALFRYWNVIKYFFPYRDIMDHDWERVLEKFIPRFISAGDTLQYHLTAAELSTYINDNHGIVNSYYLNQHFGQYFAPFTVRYIEGKTIVTNVYTDLLVNGDEIQVGDIILKRENTPINQFRQYLRKYKSSSNEVGLQSLINSTIVRGTVEQIPYQVLRNHQVIDTVVKGYSDYNVINNSIILQNSSKDKWKILPGNIGYIDMEILTTNDAPIAMSQLMNTRAIIFDLRCYPNFVWYLITPYLYPTPTNFVKFTRPNLDFPGKFDWDGDYPASEEDNPDYYKGKVIILADEQSQSRSEYHVMALQGSPNATVIGSQTCGADGNVTYLYLPGKIVTVFTGLGVYYPDRSPTQRVGVHIDVRTRPTIQGIQAGIDEVLEFAINYINSH